MESDGINAASVAAGGRRHRAQFGHDQEQWSDLALGDARSNADRSSPEKPW